MKTLFIKDLNEGDKLDDLFMVKSVDVKTDKNGNAYLDMIIGDQSGEMICRKFRATDDETEIAQSGEVLSFKGTVKEYNGQKNINAIAIGQVEEEGIIEMDDYIAAAPVPAESMMLEVKDYIKRIENKGIRQIIIEIYKQYKEKLMYYPAAKSNHHAFKSGLLYHMIRMLRSAEALANVYPNVDKDLLYAGVLLHDICKIEEMESDNMGIVSDYSMEGKLLGHIIMGVKLVEKTGEVLGVDKEIIIMLEHMLLSHHYHPEFGSPKKPMFLEAELLHYIDMIDARVYDFENALTTVDEGTFSDKVWVLDNRTIYKPQFNKKKNLEESKQLTF